MDKHQLQQQALANATQSASMANYAAIFDGFAAKGIASDQITPRENVFTFHAWKALGRQVRRGEHGVQVCTWIPMTKKDSDGEAVPIGRKPRMTTVFHVSQTEPIMAGHEYQRPAVNPIAAEQSTKADPVRREAPADYHAGYYSEEFTPIARA